MPTRDLTRSRWWMPGFSLFLGAIMLVAFTIGDNVGQGLISLGIMAVLAAIFAFGRRSETLQGIGGPGRDERWAMIDLRATAMAGLVTIIVRDRRVPLRGRQRRGRSALVADRRDRGPVLRHQRRTAALALIERRRGERSGSVLLLHRGARIRTGDLTDPNGARYQAAPRPGARRV